MFKRFFTLTKPGIIFGNLITTIGGFLLACHYNFNLILFINTICGICLIIACGCVFNNIIDRDIDKLMDRTKNRALVTGIIPVNTAIIYAIILGIAGSTFLFFTTTIALVIALTGLFFYVIVYSLWFKRNSIYGTLIGSISGSVPPVVGYCAASNQLNSGAIILFIMLTIWQMPHSYAIAIYRFKDYLNASIPVLPVKKGIATAKLHILLYTIVFMLVSLLLSIFGYTGMIYLIINLILGLYWIYLAGKGFKATDNVIWAKKVFGFSVIYLTIISIAMAIDANSVITPMFIS